MPDSSRNIWFSQGEGNTPGILLFQEYEQLDGEFISNLTCVIFQSENKNRELLRARKRGCAKCRRSGFGAKTDNRKHDRRLIAMLSFMPESEPGITTFVHHRNVQFEKNRIWTTHDVEFLPGHRGRGRDLIITLASRKTVSTQQTVVLFPESIPLN